MATLESIKAKIQKIINSANARTGSAHSDLTSAVDTLAAGYMSGESSEYYRYLTFMDIDNTSVVDTVSVAPEYNANRSVAPVLSKESTVDTVFTHSGWSLTPDGPAQNSVFSNIIKDLTLYPVFTSTVRCYTARFFDGNTFIRSEKIPYGGSSDYVYKKIGARFKGWNPAPVNITGDIDCYGTWEFASFATDSWTLIAQSAIDGDSANYYDMGDEKEIVIHYGDDKPDIHVGVRIVAFNPRGETVWGELGNWDTWRPAGMACVAIIPIANSCMAFNTIPVPGYENLVKNKYTAKGFEGSEILTYLNEQVLPYLPAELQSVLPYSRKEEFVVTNQGLSYSHGIDVKLWIPSYREVFGAKQTLWTTADGLSLSNWGDFEGDPYPYFKQVTEEEAGTGNTLNGYSGPRECRALTLLNGEPVCWWLRTIKNSNNVYIVKEDGSITTDTANNGQAYVVFGFCL